MDLINTILGVGHIRRVGCWAYGVHESNLSNGSSDLRLGPGFCLRFYSGWVKLLELVSWIEDRTSF